MKFQEEERIIESISSDKTGSNLLTKTIREKNVRAFADHASNEKSIIVK